MLFVSGGAGFFYWTTDGLLSFGGSVSGARWVRVNQSRQYDRAKRVFVNRLETSDTGSGAWFEMMEDWLLGDEQRVPPGPLPVSNPSPAAFDHAPRSGLRITWLGHSTLLIEIDGVTVLTDPVFSERSSPSRHIGPRRFHPVPIALSDLPEVDAVLISHDHYDHLDYGSIVAMRHRGSRFIAPLGVGAHLVAWGVAEDDITEIDWWEDTRVGGLQVTAAPARHFSGRNGFDANETLWASYALRTSRHRVYFSGDTGMHEQFAEIARRLGPFDLSMLEVGQYNVHWVDVHLLPEQAIQAQQILRARLLMPIHWGTFQLAFHDWDEPPRRLSQLAERHDVALFIPRPGESFEPERTPEQHRWWEDVRPVPGH